jgi:hypothetical protein
MTYDPLDAEHDPFHPPAISTLVHCIHCGEEYDSFRIEWRVEPDADGNPHGFWCCPVPGCGGMGFGFDIFPVDPEYRDENGQLMWCSDDEGDEGDEEEFDGEDDLSSFNDAPVDRNGSDADEDIPF